MTKSYFPFSESIAWCEVNMHYRLALYYISIMVMKMHILFISVTGMHYSDHSKNAVSS
jgi:hypothetical protein